MSILATHLRPLIVSNLREDMNPRIKKAMMELFNSIDQDLDEHGYSPDADTTSSVTDEAIERLEAILQSFDIPEETELLIPSRQPIEREEEEETTDMRRFQGGDVDSDEDT